MVFNLLIIILESYSQLIEKQEAKAVYIDYDYIFKVELESNQPVKVQAFQFGQAHRGGTATMR